MIEDWMPQKMTYFLLLTPLTLWTPSCSPLQWSATARKSRSHPPETCTVWNWSPCLPTPQKTPRPPPWPSSTNSAAISSETCTAATPSPFSTSSSSVPVSSPTPWFSTSVCSMEPCESRCRSRRPVSRRRTTWTSTSPRSPPSGETVGHVSHSFSWLTQLLNWVHFRRYLL